MQKIPAGYRLMPVELTPEIKDAIVESGAFNPNTIWEAVIRRHDLVASLAGQQAPAQSAEPAVAVVSTTYDCNCGLIHRRGPHCTRCGASFPAGQQASTDNGSNAMPAAFGDWFKANYPKDTLIHDPEWHAPKIYWRAVHAAPAHALTDAFPAVMLTRMGHTEMCEVSLCINKEWIVVLRDNGTNISHIVEPLGIRRAIAAHLARKG